MTTRKGVLLFILGNLVAEAIKTAVGILIVRPAAKRYSLELQRTAANRFREAVEEWLAEQSVKAQRLEQNGSAHAYNRALAHVEGMSWRGRE